MYAQASRAGCPVEELRGRAAFVGLADEWDKLADAVAPGEPFHRHAYLRTWLDNFAPHGDVRILTQRGLDGSLETGLVLLWERTRRFGVPVRQLVAPANAHSYR
ncbi:MAG: cellulose biosynthesis (CelD)-like protein, partial [Myxococcaceae bacterium]|nr:cellulose biosynthesis (CelD)-like protein [Myxococcaceae bacterium]